MMNRCSTGKRCFENEELAVDALIQNHTMNDYKEHEGPTNIYLCRKCGCWHFTSKGEKHALLTDKETLIKIRRGRLANHWERNLR